MEKIAVIDIGSNSARLVLANILEGGYFVVFDELKENVRLGQDMDWDGYIKPQRIAQTIKTLTMFRRLCDANHVDKIFAYATAAVRKAKNQKSFLDEVAMTCGIKIKVLSIEEQAMLIYQGVINSMDIPKGLIMEMGGGSTNLIYYNRKNIIHYEALQFGSVTLTDLFKNSSDDPLERTAKIEEFISEQLEKVSWFSQIDPDTQFIGVGGAFRNLGRISRMIRKYPVNMAHNYELSMSEFDNIYSNIRKLDLDSTMRIKGLSSGRADIFPSSLAAMKAVLTKFPVETITVSGCGLREGAMFRYAVPGINEKPIQDVLAHSLYTNMKYFDINIEHAEHVYNLCQILFKQLKVLHKLPRTAVRVLKIAALMHDCGMRIKYYNHQLHSHYIILNSNIYGVPHKEIIMAAFVAAGHRKTEFAKDEILRYKDILTQDDVIMIKKLSVILRIAESFDRAQSGVVTNVSCDVLGDSVIVKTETIDNAECSLEVKDALSAAEDFYSAYGKHLEIL
ncbi:MAG: Ppx/GppA family phosphatase [Clostridia bacterium]|nr:Ppx/GppA family phosphatase [Clostridia bacterium]